MGLGLDPFEKKDTGAKKHMLLAQGKLDKRVEAELEETGRD